MAFKQKAVAELLLIIKSKGKKEILTVGGLFKKMRVPALAAAAAIAAVGAAAVSLALKADRFNEVQKAFRNMATAQGQDADKMLSKMRELSVGTVSDLKLMQNANTALLLGLPVDRFGEMLNIARSASKATGQSMEFMLQSIVTGLGRGSKLILDNLGIIVDVNKAQEEYAGKLGRTAASLSDAEKKQAFINKALSIGAKNAEAAGAGGDTLTDSWDRLKASSENLAIKVGQDLQPAVKRLTDEMVAAVKWTDKLLTSMRGDDPVVKLEKDSIRLRFELQQLKAELADNNEGWFDIGRAHAAIQGDILMTEIALKQVEEQLKKVAVAATNTGAAEKNALELARIAAQEAALKKEETRLAEFDKEIDFENASTEQRLSMALKEVDQKLKVEQDFRKKRRLLAQKDNLLNVKRDVLHTKKMDQLEQDRLKRNEDWQRDSFSRIATLSNSNNRTLAAIGKAAALTQLAIDGPVAFGKALAAFPPPFNFAAAAAVGVSFAAQAAKVVGVPLAEGGIVQSSPGGTVATIGEGGRDEAVIPLDDAGSAAGIGTTINLTVNGGMLGDAAEAREFARVIDGELLRLRNDNESVAFDEGLN